MRRTASSTICFHERSSRFGTGRDMDEAPKKRDSAARQVEREDQVVDAVGGADLVAHVDEDPFRAVGVGERLDLDVADAELVLGERLLHVMADQRLRRGVAGREDKVVGAAGRFGPHLPFAEGVADDDPPGIARLDDLEPYRFECGQAIFGLLVHVPESPLFDAPEHLSLTLKGEETCSREADPYLARSGPINPLPGRCWTQERLCGCALARTIAAKAPTATREFPPGAPGGQPASQSRRRRKGTRGRR